MYTAACIYIGIMTLAGFINLGKGRYGYVAGNIVSIGIAIVLAYLWS